MKTGKWKPGQSGNPNGRPPGVGEIGRLREQIGTAVPEIIAKLIDQAKDGDSGAARLLLERVLPPIKASEQPVALSLPEGSLTEQGRAIIAAAGSALIAPGQAAQLLTGLGALAKLTETDELTRRIEKLEANNAKETI